ncbi:replication initiator protein [Bacteriophage N127_L5035_C77.3]|nr:replication initiator protein [Bacteriophage N127_L5035_C77.3]
MSCYRPLLGKFQGYEDSKPQYKVLPCSGVPAVYPDINVPCGHCIGCRLDKSRQWADRMMLELDHSKTAIFVTLTYDPLNVPVACSLDDGSVLFSLNKRDVQLFMKRLRKTFDGREIRFYLAGEYGAQTHRPHYHAILFGLSLADFPDLKPVSQNSFGQFLYSSEKMYEIWKLGNVALAEVSWQTCAYVARYCVKKLSDDVSRETYESFGVEPEFALMSRRPGIAGFYAQEHPDLIDKSKQYFSDYNGVSPRTSCPTPKFVFQKLELTNPELFAKIKMQRQIYAT